jgi:hypothetical protein
MDGLRGEGMARRRERLAQLKKGPGVFRYNGKAVDSESIPTPLRNGRNQPVFDGSGMPVVDSSGRQVYERAGTIVRDSKGQPVLGGQPKVKTIPIEVFKLWGVDFPAGEPVEISDPQLALKLRCLAYFEELEAIDVAEEDDADEKPKRKRSRSAKKEIEAEQSESES